VSVPKLPMLSSTSLPRWSDSFRSVDTAQHDAVGQAAACSSPAASDGYVGALLGWKSVKERLLTVGSTESPLSAAHGSSIIESIKSLNRGSLFGGGRDHPEEWPTPEEVQQFRGHEEDESDGGSTCSSDDSGCSIDFAKESFDDVNVRFTAEGRIAGPRRDPRQDDARASSMLEVRSCNETLLTERRAVLPVS